MQRRKNSVGTCKALMILIALAVSVFAAPNEFLIRNIYSQTSVSKTPDKVIEQIKAASAAGYNSLTSCDTELENLEHNPAKVISNYHQVIAAAKASGIKLVPWHFYQQQPARENFNLAEAFPVKGTKFMVAGSKAQGVGDHDIGLENGGFENFTGNRPDHWGVPKAMLDHCSMDKSEKRSGTASLRVKAAPSFSRITQNINLKPFRAYEISAWFKTEDIKRYTSVQFGMEPHMLYRRERPFGSPKIWNWLTPTMNWRKCQIDFNSLDHTMGKLSLWITYRHPQSGKDANGQTWEGEIWVDDIQVREVGLYETLRGKSKPIVVRSEDGSITYQEGKDYQVDPKCDSFTADDYWYEAHLTIPQGSAIKDKQELRVDWFQYANVETVIPESDFCLPKTWSTLAENLSHIDKLFGHQDAMFCNIDEWRVAGWNEHCETFKFRTAGEYMAKSWQGIEAMLRGPVNGAGNRNRIVMTYSDMFDPYHNADPKYVACNGSVRGSWAHLSDDVIIANWNIYNQRAYSKSSLKFFAGLDTLAPNLNCKQILQTQDAYDANNWADILTDLEKEGFDGVIGVNWVTWYNDYSTIPVAAAAYKAKGRWPANPFPVGIKITDQAKSIRHVGKLSALPKGHNKHAIEFTVPEYVDITLKVFDLHGRQVQSLVAGKMTAGTHRIMWNAATLSSGVYFLQLSAKNLVEKTLKQIVY